MIWRKSYLIEVETPAVTGLPSDVRQHQNHDLSYEISGNRKIKLRERGEKNGNEKRTAQKWSKNRTEHKFFFFVISKQKPKKQTYRKEVRTWSPRLALITGRAGRPFKCLTEGEIRGGRVGSRTGEANGKKKNCVFRPDKTQEEKKKGDGQGKATVVGELIFCKFRPGFGVGGVDWFAVRRSVRLWVWDLSCGVRSLVQQRKLSAETKRGNRTKSQEREREIWYSWTMTEVCGPTLWFLIGFSLPIVTPPVQLTLLPDCPHPDSNYIFIF